MLDIEWRPRAHLDRESIAIYLGVECVNPRAALATMQVIDEAIERVRAFPDSGGFFQLDMLEHHDYRTVLAGKYTVFYRYNEKTLTVYRIIHQRRDIDVFSLIKY